MDRNIKYIAYYDTTDNDGRKTVPSAITKIEYIIGCLSVCGYKTDIISASLRSNIGYCRGSAAQINNDVKLIKLPAFYWGNKFQKVIAYVWQRVALFVYLMFNLKRLDIVIVYHSPALMSIIRLLKRIKRFDFVLEAEEFYNDVISSSKRAKTRENKYILSADKYIFPTYLMNDKFNPCSKPSVTVHGTYGAEKDRNVSFGDDKIHVVYAGTFDPRKGGAVAAAAAEWLPEKYHVHILGFGSSADTENIKNTVADINSKSKAEVSYDGCLSGEEYIQFLQKCHIGLSTQNPDAAFNATSFPSKILSYMSNGLRVVTIRIPAIEKSDIGEYVYYYDKQTPEEIAKAIIGIKLDDGYDGRKRIEELNVRFCNELKRLLR